MFSFGAAFLMIDDESGRVGLICCLVLVSLSAHQPHGLAILNWTWLLLHYAWTEVTTFDLTVS